VAVRTEVTRSSRSASLPASREGRVRALDSSGSLTTEPSPRPTSNPSLAEQIPYVTTQSRAKLIQGFEGCVLAGTLQPIQGRPTDP